jgi:hypothetical protein
VSVHLDFAKFPQRPYWVFREVEISMWISGETTPFATKPRSSDSNRPRTNRSFTISVARIPNNGKDDARLNSIEHISIGAGSPTVIATSGSCGGCLPTRRLSSTKRG